MIDPVRVIEAPKKYIREVIELNVQNAKDINEESQAIIDSIVIDAFPYEVRNQVLRFIKTLENNIAIRNKAIEKLEKMAATAGNTTKTAAKKFDYKKHDKIMEDMIYSDYSDRIAIEFYNALIEELKC